jgi:hypothetical protein
MKTMKFNSIPMPTTEVLPKSSTAKSPMSLNVSSSQTGVCKTLFGLWIRPAMALFNLSRFNSVKITAWGKKPEQHEHAIVSEGAKVKNKKVYSSSSFVITNERNQYIINKKISRSR